MAKMGLKIYQILAENKAETGKLESLRCTSRFPVHSAPLIPGL